MASTCSKNKYSVVSNAEEICTQQSRYAAYPIVDVKFAQCADDFESADCAATHCEESKYTMAFPETAAKIAVFT